jgi:hypothetical protein
MESSQLAGSAQSDTLLLEEGDRQSDAEIGFCQLQMVRKIDCNLHGSDSGMIDILHFAEWFPYLPLHWNSSIIGDRFPSLLQIPGSEVKSSSAELERWG